MSDTHHSCRGEKTDSCWPYCCFQGETSTQSPHPLCLPQATVSENLWVRHCLHSGWPADTPPKLTNSCSVPQMCVTQHFNASHLHTVLKRRRRTSGRCQLSGKDLQHGSLNKHFNWRGHKSPNYLRHIRRGVAKHLVACFGRKASSFLSHRSLKFTDSALSNYLSQIDIRFIHFSLQTRLDHYHHECQKYLRPRPLSLQSSQRVVSWYDWEKASCVTEKAVQALSTFACNALTEFSLIPLRASTYWWPKREIK